MSTLSSFEVTEIAQAVFVNSPTPPQDVSDEAIHHFMACEACFVRVMMAVAVLKVSYEIPLDDIEDDAAFEDEFFARVTLELLELLGP